MPEGAGNLEVGRNPEDGAQSFRSIRWRRTENSATPAGRERARETEAMGKLKRGGENSKAVDARNKKAAAKKDKNAKVAKDKEDAYWASQGDGEVSKGKKKKQEQEAKRREAAAKKEEARKLLAAEEAALAKPKKPQKASVVQKVTRAQLAQQKEKDQEQLKQKIEAQNRRDKDRTVTEEEYEALVTRPNLNHETDLVQAKVRDPNPIHLIRLDPIPSHPSARSADATASFPNLKNVEQAIEGLQSVGLGAPPVIDLHPERRLRAAYKVSPGLVAQCLDRPPSRTDTQMILLLCPLVARAGVRGGAAASDQSRNARADAQAVQGQALEAVQEEPAEPCRGGEVDAAAKVMQGRETGFFCGRIYR